jgi:hypothetical protein
MTSNSGLVDAVDMALNVEQLFIYNQLAIGGNTGDAIRILALSIWSPSVLFPDMSQSK